MLVYSPSLNIMNPEHKKYILCNVRKKSVKEIAADLNLKERRVREFLEKQIVQKKQIDAETESTFGQKGRQTPTQKRTIFLSIVLIITLGFAVYGNSLNNEFIWDDHHLIGDNVYIKNWSHLAQIFTQSIGAGAGKQYFSYRPLQIITYLIDYSFWKLDVRGYHLTNIILHILAALSIYWLILTLYDDRLLSLFTAILFIVHPVHTAAVTYISGRADSLAAIFLITCFVLYLKNLRLNRLSLFIPMVVCYLLAIFSRENSLILPALLLLYHYSFRIKVNPGQFFTITGCALIYILARLTVLSSLAPHTSAITTTVLQRLPGFFVALTNYLKIMFLPLVLHMEYGNRIFTMTGPKAVAGVIIASVLLFYAFKKRNEINLVSFSIFWFFLALLPMANLYPIPTAYMAEHWLYLPSVGFFLILARGLRFGCDHKGLKPFSILLLIVLVVFYSGITIRQNRYWKKPIKLYKMTLRHVPDSVRTLSSLGVLYNNSDREEDAIKLFKKAIELNPAYADAYSHLGNAYSNLGKNEEAIGFFKKAIEIRPDYADAYNNLGVGYDNLNRNEDAITAYRKAIEINPNFVGAYYNLGNAYAAIGKKEEADVFYKKALAANPNYAEAFYALGNSYKAGNRNKEAITSYTKAITIDPAHTGAYNNLGAVYAAMDRKEEAEGSYKKAIELKGDHAKAYYNLGNLYVDMDRKAEAEAAYKKAIEIKPDYAIAYSNLAIIYFERKQYPASLEYFKKAERLGFVNPDLAKALTPYGN